MEKYFASEIWLYPIKSCKGISVSNAPVDERGIKYDRRWMIVDSFGHYVTQRKKPTLALVCVSLVDGYVFLSAPKMPDIRFPIDKVGPDIQNVTIWGDKCVAQSVNKKVSEWFSDYLNFKVKLVFLPDNSVRQIDPKYSVGPFSTSFTDGFPFLLISQATLDDLNGRLLEKLPMDRFRPNLVVSCKYAFEEDLWQTIKIGDVVMQVVKPCARCVVTTTNQDTGKRGKEPLTTLAKYRNINGKLMFGQNLIHQNTGTIQLGDEINVLKSRKSS